MTGAGLQAQDIQPSRTWRKLEGYAPFNSAVMGAPVPRGLSRRSVCAPANSAHASQIGHADRPRRLLIREWHV
jgi:hypothetical protein